MVVGYQRPLCECMPVSPSCLSKDSAPQNVQSSKNSSWALRIVTGMLVMQTEFVLVDCCVAALTKHAGVMTVDMAELLLYNSLHKAICHLCSL